MNVVMVGPFGLKKKSTMRERALPMARALVQRGHTVTIIVPPWDSPEDAGIITNDAGVTLINAPLPKLPAPFFHLILAQWLARLALQQQPDVIHFFKPKAYAGLAHVLLHALKRLRQHTIGLVVDEDDWEQAWNDVEPYSSAQKKLFAWQEPWGLLHADAVTVASRELAALTIATGQLENAVFYVPNGVRGLPGKFDESRVLAAYRTQFHTALASIPPQNEYPAFSPLAHHREQGEKNRHYSGTVRATFGLAGKPVVLLYTRFFEFNLEFLQDVIHGLHKRMPDAHWLIVGKGFFGEEKELRRSLAGLPVESHVHFAGWVDAAELQAYFSAADVAVYPYDDTLLNRTKCSVKLIDLLANGVPVVASNVGQNREYILQDQNGRLVPPGNVTAMVNSLAHILENDALQPLMSMAAMKHMHDFFTWNKLVSGVEAAYRYAIAHL